MPAAQQFSLTSEADLAKADEHLRKVSYVEGGASWTKTDLKHFETAKKIMTAEKVKEQYPSVSRWFRHMQYQVEETESVSVGSLSGTSSLFAAQKLSENPKGSCSPPEPSTSSTSAKQGGGAQINGRKNNKDQQSQKAAPSSAGPAAAAKPAYVKGSNVKEVDCKVVPMADRQKRLPQNPSKGLAAANLPTSKGKETRYLTTAIHYTNGWPHVGHAYETIQADCLARYFRLNNYDTFFQTGTDEHGQKIAEAATAQGMAKPKDLCDYYCQGFEGLFGRTEVSEDQFIRTSSPEHYKIVQDLWKKVSDKGDIYLAEYEGWYMVREEKFVTDQEAEEWKFLDPVNGKPLQRMKEPSYFFRMSKYKDFIREKLSEPGWCKPDNYRKEMLARLDDMEAKGGLRDLSISRANFDWGIPVPEKVGPDGKKHVMYVWFDALTNYYSGVSFNPANSKYWPANMHVIGKDIIWFHTAIWGSMLKSAELPLPKQVVVHGFVNDAEGKKMSKSEGNVVNPHDICDWCSPDTLRWYLIREAHWGNDLPFSVKSLKLMHNADLCDNLGNLVNRAVSLCKGAVPAVSDAIIKECGLPFDVAELRKKFCEAFEDCRTGETAEMARIAAAETNKWLADLEPWKMNKQDPVKAAGVVRICLEAVYVLAHFFAPFIPRAAEAIVIEKLQQKNAVAYGDLKPLGQNLKEGAPVGSTSILFQSFSAEQIEIMTTTMSLEQPAPVAKAAAAPAVAKAQPKQGGKGGDNAAKEKKPKEKKAAGPAAPALDMDQPLYSRLDLRVGKIVEVENHPDAERLYVEKIDVGEAEPRTIISGLREHYTLEEMKGRQIVTICNLKPAKMRGITSHGMVLCAKTEDGKVQFAALPKDCKPGDHILVEGDSAERKPWDGKQVDKHQVWADASKLMRTDGAGVPCFDGNPLVVNGQRLSSDFKNAILS
ncbi:unnamed protein product [Amoebophrya sp. A120]|nr:unnamed protein product [Amoebophrya sp. A120]|eukprot:GSA120T00005652001.1